MNRYVIRKWFRTTGWRVAHADESVGLMTQRAAFNILLERLSDNADKMVERFELCTDSGESVFTIPA